MMDFAAESIVRDLAASDPAVESNTSAYDYDPVTVCMVCDVEAPQVWDENHRQHVDGPIDHKPECAWRRAREWVDANPPRVTPGYQL